MAKWTHQQQVAAIASRLRGSHYRSNHQVHCDLKTIVNTHIANPKITWLETEATCSRCGNQAWMNGDSIRHRKAALIRLREGCPLKQRNYYFNQQLLEEEAEEIITKKQEAAGIADQSLPAASPSYENDRH